MLPQQEMTTDVLINAMKKHENAKAFLLEGYPRDVLQVEQFNEKVCNCTPCEVATHQQ